MPYSEKSREALAKARAVKAERRAALRTANAQMVEMVRRVGIEHLGEIYLPPSQLLSTALLAQLSESRGHQNDK